MGSAVRLELLRAARAIRRPAASERDERAARETDDAQRGSEGDDWTLRLAVRVDRRGLDPELVQSDRVDKGASTIDQVARANRAVKRRPRDTWQWRQLGESERAAGRTATSPGFRVTPLAGMLFDVY